MPSFRPRSPRARRAPGSFYGWWMVAACTAAMILTTPGQTIGVSTFTDHIIESLGIGRSRVSAAYLVGTMSAATLAPAVGRMIDRRGVRIMMIGIGVAFGFAAMAMAVVQGIVSLTIGFFFIRLLGQGSLSLTANTGIAIWFEERRGRAVAASMSVSQAVMAFAPLVLTALVAAVDWRLGFVVCGLVVLVVVPSVGATLVVDRPADIGQVPDGPTPPLSSGTHRAQPNEGPAGSPAAEPAAVGSVPGAKARASLTRGEAVRTRAFWLLSILLSIDSAIFTGIVFHNVSIMEANGLNETEAAAVFVPFFVTSLLATWLAGEMTDRVSHVILLPISGLLMAATYVLVTVVSPGLMMVVYSLVLGASSGSLRAISGALYPKFFGVANIGAIRGVAFLISGAASGLGPLIVSLGRDITGSYDPALRVAAVVALIVGASAATIQVPRRL